MLASSANAPPQVSIILPTYNRARFLPQAFAAIRAQTWTDWELIVVDDGGNDNTRELVERLQGEIAQPLHFVYQENQGPYGARNTGLGLARGRYLAFYDSDDVWLPHHLRDCVAALEANPEVDWVYGACRIVDYRTGRETAPSHFYERGKARPFLRLRHRTAGPLRIIDDPGAARCALLHGLHCGLQHSVLRSELFAAERFQTALRNEAEDQLVVIRALVAGRRFGYFDNVHVIYHEHEQNSSAAGTDRRLEKLLPVLQTVARGFEELPAQVSLTWGQRRALARRLAQEYFWVIGYALLWQNGRREEALAMFRKGLRLTPWDLRFWKTYVLALVRHLASAGVPSAPLEAQALVPGADRKDV